MRILSAFAAILLCWTQAQAGQPVSWQNAPVEMKPFLYMQPDLDALAPDGKLSMSGVSLDLAPARFSLEVKDFEEDERPLGQGLSPSYQTVFKRLKGKPFGMVTANMVDALGKELFDSALAGISLAVERDPETSKDKMLRELLAGLEQKKSSMQPAVYDLVFQLLDGALKAPRPGPDASPKLMSFLSDPMLSTPIGFWTWNDELKGIFTQDRFLQSVYTFESDAAAFDALQGLLKENPQAAKTYRLYAGLEQKLNNPFSKSSLLEAKPRESNWAFLPSTRSNETELQKEFAARGVLLMDPMEEVIKRLKAGTLTFKTKPDSGYYDYQQNALEAILLADRKPEAKKVDFGVKYLKRLEEAFKTGMAKARESHVKSQEIFKGMIKTAMPPPPSKIFIHPFLPLEPLPTAYARYAEGFDFLLRSLDQLDLPARGQSIMAYDPYGGKPGSALGRLKRARKLFYGLELIAADELGMPRSKFKKLAGVDEASAVEAAKKWLASASQSPELGRDARFAVPVSADPPDKSPRMIYCWGTAGVSLLKVEVKFATKPGYEKPPRDLVEFIPADYYLAADKFMAFKVPYEKGPLTREQFRHVLDTSKSLDEAKARLKRGER